MNKLAIPLALLFSSCYTAKKANKHLAQAQAQYPAVVRAACVNYYPSKDSISEVTKYIQGRTDTVIEMVEINCGETIFFDTIINNVEVVKEKIVPKFVKVPCPTTTNRVDTFYKHKLISYENTALLAVKDAVIDSITIKAIEASKSAKDWRKKAIFALIAVSALLAALSLIIYFKFIK